MAHIKHNHSFTSEIGFQKYCEHYEATSKIANLPNCNMDLHLMYHAKQESQLENVVWVQGLHGIRQRYFQDSQNGYCLVRRTTHAETRRMGWPPDLPEQGGHP